MSLDLEKLKEDIKQAAREGVDFGCECYYCGATPIDLVERNDAIPVIYIMDGKNICFRCTDGGYYIIHDHVKDIAKKIELIKAYSGFDDAFRETEIKRLSKMS